MLPSTHLAMPPRPCVDITTSAVESALAWAAMASAGVPRCTTVDTECPAASRRSRTADRLFSARCWVPDTIWSITARDCVPSMAGGRMSKDCSSSMGTDSDFATSSA